jgi:hypothetical protein
MHKSKHVSQQITRAFVVSNTVLQQAQTEQHDESS